MVAYKGTPSVSVVHPFVCIKNQPLNLKLFNVDMGYISVDIPSRVRFFLLLSYSPQAESPTLYLLLEHRDLTSIVNRFESCGVLLTSFILFRKSVISHTYDFISLASGSMW